MPVEWRLHVLEERLRSEYGEVFEVQVTDLYGLAPLEQSAALDAMIALQGDFPITLVNGEVACVNDIDVDAIAKMVGDQLR